MKSVIICLILVGFCSCATTYLKLGAIFQDNMVLQKEPYRAQLWGYAKPHSYVYARLEGADYRGRSDANGFWVITMDPHKQNDRAYSIHINSGDELIILNNVLFGDVWICAGQSNMEMNIEVAYNKTKTFEEGDDYQTYRLMRIMSIKRKWSDKEEKDFQPEDIQLPWQYPTSQALGKGRTDGFSYFSATCFHFGNSLYHRTYVPIGLISLSFSSSTIESWVSQDIFPLCKNPYFPSKVPFEKPSRLYNAMINPLIHTTIKGMVWYQGESNYANPGDYKTNDGYACFFPKMIEDYRTKFSKNSNTNPKFPFGFVQLAGYCDSKNHTCDGRNENIGDIRYAQTADYGFAPNPAMQNTFMAEAMDLPDPLDTEPKFGDLHPRSKLDVGIRLANGALKFAYNVDWVSYTGPVFDSCAISGKELHIQFNKELLGNDAVNVKNERGVEVYSNNNWLSVPIINHSQTNITISLENAPNPSMVRYAWANNPCCPLAYQFEKPVRCPNYQCALYTQNGNLPTPPFLSSIVNGRCSN